MLITVCPVSSSKMTPTLPYSGPKALSFSKHAPQLKKFSLGDAIVGSSFTVAASPVADNVIAAKEQIAASNTNSQVAGDDTQNNPDIGLDIAIVMKENIAAFSELRS